jgi:Periplasmic copper-binding protein (NosD)
VAALLCALAALSAIPALAAAASKEFTVNVTNIGPGDAGCETPGSSEECTLPAAIALANGNPGKDVIKFDPTVFQGAAPSATITLSTALPPITEAVEILGGRCTTGRVGGGGQFVRGPCVELTLNATASTSILTAAASDVTVEGLAFEGAGNGIRVEEFDTGFAATNDWFGDGLNSGGGSANGAAGIRLEAGADGATIGGTAASERNVFARAEAGIELEGASLVKILGNYIGIGPTGVGTAGLETGVKIGDSPTVEARFDEIGGALNATELSAHECVGPCNVIATELGQGIDLGGNSAPASAADGPTQIVGNYIGLGADGETLVGENETGVAAIPSAGGCAAGPGSVTVGGPEATEANFIDGGFIGISAEKSENFSALGNNIGIAADGTETDGPQLIGIELCNTGVVDPSHITGNHMILGPDAAGVESVNGNAQIIGNSIKGSRAGIELATTNNEGGAIVSGNSITEPDTYGVRVESDSNVIVGNSISKAGRGGILVETDSDHNRIGGDGAGEANTIVETVGPEPEDGAITIFGRETGRNEIAANTGFGNPGAFIKLIGHGGSELPNGGIQPPTLGVVLQSSASGTAAADATVRLFSKTSAEPGELGTFLGKVVAGANGAWAATFAKQPVGALIAATATSEAGTAEAGTSEVSAPVAAAVDPVAPVVNPPQPAPVIPISPPQAEQPKAPTVKITKGPKKTSKSTTAKFTFKASPASGAKFECKLDGKKWAKCKSPVTYKKLKPGKHTFQVRALVTGVPASKPAKYQFTVKP